jgi:hypothetical protein
MGFAVRVANLELSFCHPERGRMPESKDPEDISVAHAVERHSLKDFENLR